VDVDVSGIEEPLKMRGRPEFIVGEGTAKDLHVVLTGRAIKVRTLPPTQSGGSGPAGTDSTGIKARTGGRSSSKENLP